MKNWKPNSWRTKTGKHLPVYENEAKLNEVLKEISKLLGAFPVVTFIEMILLSIDNCFLIGILPNPLARSVI